MAFRYSSPVSINSAQVPSTQTDFPVLVSFTDARFKTFINGGHVQNSSGFDIRPYDSTGLAITGYELERYNASTGEVVMWVKVPSLSSSTTPIYLRYGDPSITTDGSSTTTWSNSFRSVYHLKDGTTMNLNDAKGSFNGSSGGGLAAAVGKIDGGVQFTAGQMTTSTNGTYCNNLDTTISCWFKTSTTATNMVLISKGAAGGGWFLFITTANSIQMQIKDTGGTAQLVRTTTSTTVTDGNWHYIACTFHINTTGTSGQDIQLYLDGALNQGSLQNTAATSDKTDESLLLGTRGGATLPYTGTMDEARIATSVARSADWVATEYNNQSAPSTFATLGVEASLGGDSNFLLFF